MFFFLQTFHLEGDVSKRNGTWSRHRCPPEDIMGKVSISVTREHEMTLVVMCVSICLRERGREKGGGRGGGRERERERELL